MVNSSAIEYVTQTHPPKGKSISAHISLKENGLTFPLCGIHRFGWTVVDKDSTKVCKNCVNTLKRRITFSSIIISK